MCYSGDQVEKAVKLSVNIPHVNRNQPHGEAAKMKNTNYKYLPCQHHPHNGSWPGTVPATVTMAESESSTHLAHVCVCVCVCVLVSVCEVKVCVRSSLGLLTEERPCGGRGDVSALRHEPRHPMCHRHHRRRPAHHCACVYVCVCDTSVRLIMFLWECVGVSFY